MKTNAAMINNNLKSFWISMGGKEDIAYNNCKIMMAKFDELGVKYTYSEYPGGHTWPYGETICTIFPNYFLNKADENACLQESGIT
jgi:hypothetical protein